MKGGNQKRSEMWKDNNNTASNTNDKQPLKCNVLEWKNNVF